MDLGEVKQEIEEASKKAKDFFEEYSYETSIGAWLPSGVIRRIDELTPRWPYLPYERRRTCACVVQLCDVNRYFLNTYRVGLTAGSMFVWHCSLPVIALIETLLYEVGVNEDWISQDAKFKKCINTLNSKGIYGERIKEKLHELREHRNNIHLHGREDPVRIHDGKPRLYNKAVLRLYKVEKRLREYYGYASNK